MASMTGTPGSGLCWEVSVTNPAHDEGWESWIVDSLGLRPFIGVSLDRQIARLVVSIISKATDQVCRWRKSIDELPEHIRKDIEMLFETHGQIPTG